MMLNDVNQENTVPQNLRDLIKKIYRTYGNVSNKNGDQVFFGGL